MNGFEKIANVVAPYLPLQVVGLALTTTNPGVPTKYTRYDVVTAGTYANFKDVSNASLVVSSGDIAAGQVQFLFSPILNYWVKRIIAVDTANFYTKSELAPTLLNASNSADAIERNWNIIPSEPVPVALCGYLNTTSTFSGWLTSIGVQTNFNAILRRVKSRTTPITSIRWLICVDNEAGSVIVDKTLIVNILANTSQDILFELGSTYVNPGSVKLVHIVLCNQFTDLFGIQTNNYYPASTYQIAKYVTSGSLVTTSMTAIGGSNNITGWFKIGMVSGVLKQTVVDSILSSSETTLKSYFDNIAKSVFQSVYIQDSYSADKVATFNTPVFYNDVSTFSGWGSSQGTPQYFNAVGFILKSRLGGADITSVRCVLRIGSSTGTIIQDSTLVVNVPSGTYKYITFFLSSQYSNVAADKLFFSYAANALVDNYGAAGNDPFPESAGYSRSVFYTSGTQTGTGNLGSSDANRVWCEFGNFVSVVGLSQRQIDYISQKLSLNSSIGLPSVGCLLPSQLYALEGKELNVYFDAIVYSNFGRNDLSFDITCVKGKQLERRWTYTPASSDAGTTSLLLSVRYKGVEILSKTTTVITKSLSSGAGAIKVFPVGDSTMSTAQHISPVLGETLPALPVITFYGTLGSSPKKHEGRSGLGYLDYATTTTLPYWNVGTSQLDIAAYLTSLSVTPTANDFVMFNLGINDVFRYTTFSLSVWLVVKGYIDALINAWRVAVPGIKIGIAAIIPPCVNQDGFGESYFDGNNLSSYLPNYYAFVDRILTNYDTVTMRSNGIIIVPFNCNFDRVNNVQKSSEVANARNTDLVVRYTNGVHPAQSGYDQMNDTLLATIIYVKSLSS
ncbi:MAG: hypothetical protein JWQ09_1124 [Segetibacter sp.]|nr:hypothetical protein [Segetibacter sp.]